MQDSFRRSTLTLPLPTTATLTPGAEPTLDAGTLPTFTAGDPDTFTAGTEPTLNAGTLPSLTFGLAVGTSKATYRSPRPQRIAGAQLCLSDTGTGAGATAVNININGAAVNAAGSLSIAGAAAGNSVSTVITGGSNQYPGGARLNAGDVVTVDLASVPATTAPKAGFVVLDIVEVDV